MALRPRFNDIPDHLRELAEGIPHLPTPIWYAGTVYGDTAQQIEDATSQQPVNGHDPAVSSNGAPTSGPPSEQSETSGETNAA